MNTPSPTSLGRDEAPLIPWLESKGVQPLWDRYQKLVTREPQPSERAHQWRWEEMLPLIERAAREVSMENAERRVLMLTNPDFEGEIATSGSMIGALQILQAGESAEAHRHSAAAVRLILEADGAATLVNGHRCEMRRGDLILTPSWCWHGHENGSGSRAVWFDGLDVPLVRRNLDAHFFELDRVQAPFRPVSCYNDLYGESQVAADGGERITAYSPRFRYAWASTRDALDALPPARDGSRRFRYPHATTGGAVMPTLDCYALQLARGRDTTPIRTTYSTICVALEGEGSSTIGDRRIEWSENDVFTVPHWTWAAHRGSTERARLFLLTDREVHARLDLLREETRPD